MTSHLPTPRKRRQTTYPPKKRRRPNRKEKDKVQKINLKTKGPGHGLAVPRLTNGEAAARQTAVEPVHTTPASGQMK